MSDNPPLPNFTPPVPLSIQSASTAAVPMLVDPRLPTFAQHVKLTTLDGSGELKLHRSAFGQVPIAPGEMLVVFINIARISTGETPAPAGLIPPPGAVQ